MFFDISFLLPYLIFFIPSLTIHEFSHAFIANKLGDNTSKLMGRHTLNPFAHLDLWGTLAIFLIGFGWAKPVPVNPSNFKNPRRDYALVALSGPLSNLIIAIIGLIIIKIIGFNSILVQFILTNIILGVFNLIPLGSLDGFNIVSGFLPPKLANEWLQNKNLSYILLIIMLILPINGQTIISFILNSINHFIWSITF